MSRPSPDADEPTLGPQWIGVRRRPDQLADLMSRPGWLTLTGEGEGMGAFRPVFVGHRQQHQTCEIRTVIDAGAGVGGLAVRYDEEFHYEVEVGDGRITARAVIPGFVREASTNHDGGPVELVLASRVPEAKGMGHVSSDLVTFGFRRLPLVEQARERSEPAPPPLVEQARERSEPAVVETLLEVDARYLSNETAGSFTGRVFGVYAVTGTVAFDRIDYEGDNS